ncbi:hypothetical protein JCM11491_005687 [Sporobolomyces phaffii]
MAQPSPTPSSEIIHLVSTFADTLDSLPPSLTRSLSDLKELDAVLSGSLQSITDKLKLLVDMMNTPPPGSSDPDARQYTPLERLKLLREVTEDARTFQVGGEDKIRVATNTCESISTSTSHLSTLSSLLLSFLPGHLLPQLPAPSAPHGYPSSSTPASSLARRQLFDYPAARQHASQPTTQRAARDPYDSANRGRSGAANGKKRAAVDPYNGMMAADDYAYVPGGGGAGGERASTGRKQQQQQHYHQDHSLKDPSQRHPNQYTKKRAQAQASALGGGAALAYGNAIGSSSTGAAASLYPPIPTHPLGMTAVDSVKEKRRGGAGANEPFAPAMSQNGNSSRAGSVVGGNGGHAYGPAGMASQDEYNLATLGGQRAAAKRKQEDVSGASKRRKKGIESPDPVARTLPGQVAATAKVPRRQASTIINEPTSPAQMLPLDDEFEALEGDDDADKTLYCFCQRVSFGEMIACDAPDCEHEWFHLPCVGLKSIPDGRWFCDECRRANPKKKRR